ncbi:MAG: sugar MFS transporter [Armatimonadota bacterium]
MPRLSALTYKLSFTLLCYGLVVFSFGPCLTSIAETYHIPLGRTGLLFSLYSVGLIPTVLLTGFLADTLGKRRIIFGAILTLGLSSALFAGAPAVGAQPIFGLALAVMVLMGIGAGGIESIANALIADENQPSPGFAMNFVHAFFAVGAVVGPLGAGLLLHAGLPWQFVFVIGAALIAILLTTMRAGPRAHAHEAENPLAALGLFRSPLLWLLLIVLSFYVGAETGFSVWVSPLMEKTLGADRGTAALAVSIFWAFMIVGRLATSVLSARYLPAPLLLAAGVGSALASYGAARSPSVAMCLAMAAANGLFMSGVFGLVATDAARYFPEKSGAVFGILTAGVGIGVIAIPALMGVVATAADLRMAMLIPAVLMATVALVYVVPWSR